MGRRVPSNSGPSHADMRKIWTAGIDMTIGYFDRDIPEGEMERNQGERKVVKSLRQPFCSKQLAVGSH